MSKRRIARERAVQFLFQYELNPPDNLDAALDEFWEAHRIAGVENARRQPRWGESILIPPPTEEETALRQFTDLAVRGVLQHREVLDAHIVKYAQNWDLHRMAVVDRNVLRLAMYEMLYREDIPPVVSINEAVDIAKKYSTQDSGKFVNGILDKMRAELLRPARTAKDPA